ncbi:hypothetical protein WJX73_009943 [Symbiochloris irregularis]|uniref:Uncharacterized protein n=1 Tax=Symbiochloris irregularis TaxID=706552 RepID=A0AAW1NIN3_9CHLO
MPQPNCRLSAAYCLSFSRGLSAGRALGLCNSSKGLTQVALLLAFLVPCLSRGLLQAQAQNLHEESLPGCISSQGKCFTPANLCNNGTAWTDKLIVVAGNKHSHRWLDALGVDVPRLTYQHLNPDLPHFFVNYALEAYAYLQYFVQYYDCLPEVTALLHGHPDSWHSHPMNETLAKLDWKAIPGYLDLNRKQPIWTRPLKATPPHPVGPLAEGRDVYNGSFVPGQIVGGVAYTGWEVYVYRQRLANKLFFDEVLGPLGVGAMPDHVSYHCCTQIAVTRAQVHNRSKEFYRTILLWLQDNTVQAIHSGWGYSKERVLADAVDIFWPIILNLTDSQLTPECDVYRDGTKPECQSTGQESYTGRTQPL